MSTFTNWNGPSGGPTLPQVTTLEQLITELGTLKQQVNQINQLLLDTNSGLNNHTDDSNIASKHQTLTNLITQLQNRVVALTSQLSQHNVVGLPDSWVDNLWTLRTAIDKLDADTTTDYNNILTMISALQQSTIGIINNGFADFRNFTYVRAPNRNLGGTFATGAGSGRRIVAILGYLSDVWDNTPNASDGTMHGPGGGNRAKAGTAYVKYTNHMPWDAVIDMAATFDTVNVNWEGAITSCVSKSDDRHGTKFHLVHGTLANSADTPSSVFIPSSTARIYLAVEAEDILAETQFSPANSLEFYVSGINFIPINQGQGPNGIVVSIAETIASNNGFDSIVSDNYLDNMDNGVAVTDENANTLTIGNNVRQLIFSSSARPIVNLADGSSHKMAFITDLSQSIYWQRNVAIVVPEASTLTGLTKIQLSAEATDTYTFVDGDVALVQDSGQKEAIPDGSTTATLSTIPTGSANIATSTITGTALFKGAVLIDPAGTMGTITSDPFTDTDNVSKVTVSYTVTANEYTKSQYYNYTVAGGWTAGDLIDIPTTWDKHISDVTYQWSGNVLVTGETFYNMADVTWTPHHENTYFEPVTAWQYTFQSFNGYYTRTQIDSMVNNINAEYTVQADWASSDNLSLAYIHNKPWTGFATIEGGTFDGNFLDPILFMVDAGDFSIYPANARMWGLPTSEQYQNVIIKTMAGPHGSDPELVDSSNYSYFNNVLRLRQLNDTDPATVTADTFVAGSGTTAPSTTTTVVTIPATELAWNDRGKTLYRIPAINDDSSLPTNYKAYVTDIEYSLVNNIFYVTTYKMSNYTDMLPSYKIDPFFKVTSDLNNPQMFQFVFDSTSNTLTIGSSQVSTNTQNITAINSALGTPAVTPVPGPIYQRIETLESDMTSNVTALSGRIGALETVVGNVTSPVAGLMAQVQQNTSNITTINSTIAGLPATNTIATQAWVVAKNYVTSISYATGTITVTKEDGTSTAVATDLLYTQNSFNNAASTFWSSNVVAVPTAEGLFHYTGTGFEWVTLSSLTAFVNLSGNVSTLQTSVTQNTTDIASLKTSVTTNTTDIATINSDISTINGNITTINGQISSLQTNMLVKNPTAFQQITGYALTVVSTDGTTSVSILPTGTITAASVTGLNAPVNSSDAANKAYVDGKLSWMVATIPTPPNTGGPYTLQYDTSTQTFSWVS